MSLVLEATKRSTTGKGAARQLRREGLIPAVCYGKGIETFSLSVDPVALTRLIQGSPKGRNTVLELQMNGDTHHVMVHAIQRDPVRRTLVHVDFQAVSDDDELVVEVPVTPIGRSKGEELGGRLMMVRRSVEVRCKVKDIPEVIEHEVTALLMGDHVRASELHTPPGCEVRYDTDFAVISVVKPRGVTAAEEAEAEEVLEAEGDEAAEAPEGGAR